MATIADINKAAGLPEEASPQELIGAIQNLAQAEAAVEGGAVVLLTIKPQTGEVEYGIQGKGGWLRHGLVVQVAIDQGSLDFIAARVQENAAKLGLIAAGEVKEL